MAPRRRCPPQLARRASPLLPSFPPALSAPASPCSCRPSPRTPSNTKAGPGKGRETSSATEEGGSLGVWAHTRVAKTRGRCCRGRAHSRHFSRPRTSSSAERGPPGGLANMCGGGGGGNSARARNERANWPADGGGGRWRRKRPRGFSAPLGAENLSPFSRLRQVGAQRALGRHGDDGAGQGARQRGAAALARPSPPSPPAVSITINCPKTNSPLPPPTGRQEVRRGRVA